MHGEQIFTDVTLRTLKGEGLDMQRLGTWLRLCVPRTGPSILDLKSAFDSHYRQMLAGERVKLSSKQCTDLLAINDCDQIWDNIGRYKAWNHDCGHQMRCSDKDQKSLCHNSKAERFHDHLVQSHINDDKNFHVTFLHGARCLDMKTTPERNIFRLQIDENTRP